MNAKDYGDAAKAIQHLRIEAIRQASISSLVSSMTLEYLDALQDECYQANRDKGDRNG